MSLPSHLKGLSEVKGALVVDPDGRLVTAEPDLPGASDSAAAIATAVTGIASAGRTARLGAIGTLFVKGAASSSVTAVRPDAILAVTVDPATTTHQVERALREWAQGAAGAPARAATAPRPTTPAKPLPAQPAAAPVPAFAPRPAPAGASSDAWAALRKTLGRGLLNEAVAWQGQLASAADPERAGSEPVPSDACDRTVRALLEGIGSVMAGDGVGGGRILEPLAGPEQANLSFRWLARLWSARASLKSGAIAAARAHVQEALTTARQLDIEARALSQWIAAEVLAQDSDSTRALAWLGESRSRFEKIGDRWGMGQTWLSEARVLTSAKREADASEAARQAAALVPDAEEPHVVLARLAVIREDLAAADALLAPLRTQSAERVRALVGAIRARLIAPADAAEFLREQEAPPSERALRALERISNAAPRFVQAREALAWMLLRIGRYDESGAVFRGLLSHPLSPGDRASVMLGLGCIANAQGTAAPAATLRQVVATGTAPARPAGDELPPLPPLSASAVLARGPQNGTAGNAAVFSGQLSSFALPDLLEFLRTGKRTGLLVCSSAAGMGALRFRDGWITGAASPATPSVGEVLVRTRKVRPEALQAIASSVAGDQGDLLVGERIVRDGLADAKTVQKALEQQIGYAIRELMQWTDGEFTFSREADAAGPGPTLQIALDPQGLLLNFFKEMDEASRGAASS
jgi:predicted regulator of Ras-like GTPase activity (Roadblock/LC7/MglB family)